MRLTSSTSSVCAPPRSRITVAAWRGGVAVPGLYSSPGSPGRARGELLALDSTRSVDRWSIVLTPSDAAAGNLRRMSATPRPCSAGSASPAASSTTPTRATRTGASPRDRLRGHPRHVVLPRLRSAQARLRPLRGLRPEPDATGTHCSRSTASTSGIPTARCPARRRRCRSSRREGVRLQLADGRELIDGMSSWWCAIHGYRHPALDAAVREQLGRMAHVMFGGLTHEPAVRLAERLVELAPDGLERVFFADSGSVSVEVAIKLCLQFQRATRPSRAHAAADRARRLPRRHVRRDGRLRPGRRDAQPVHRRAARARVRRAPARRLRRRARRALGGARRRAGRAARRTSWPR